MNPAAIGSLPSPGLLLAGAVAAAAASLWLLLPRGPESRGARRLGLLLGGLALAGFVATGRRLGGIGEEAVFLIVSLVAVFSGAATIVTRSPVYSAIWFALSLAGVAGLLLVLGAQFLGVATIVVYAGAILVMFLFVLMLAQPSGLASYDRVSNEPLLAAVAGAVLLGLLTLSIGRMSAGPAAPAAGSSAAVPAGSSAAVPAGSSAAVPAGSSAAVPADPLTENHVARLGGELFGRHLVAVEAAGVLLLVALIGAIAVVSRGDEAAALEHRPPRGDPAR